MKWLEVLGKVGWELNPKRSAFTPLPTDGGSATNTAVVSATANGQTVVGSTMLPC
ncbi:MAG: hypothetical protein IPK02_12050 [Candidatus Accumulibacter sp.]|uniref:Uncharacterized protein n=1 Tax=Candidatus Accumulibacter affinis TaxID=2954384 RepID=A0A935TC17_9PROT|nr:hypothetical protein [Candidatus Accumulibacter affinis]